MFIHPDTLYAFAIGKQTPETQEQLQQMTDYLLRVFDDEQLRFACGHDVPMDDDATAELRHDYALYVADLLLGLRERMQERKKQMNEEGTFDRMVLFLFAANEFDRIEQTEWSNAKQLAQLSVVHQFRLTHPGATILKRWVAHSGACEKCQAMDA